MDLLDTYRQIIMSVLAEYTRIPYAYGELQSKTIFDRDSDSYILVTIRGLQPRSCGGTSLRAWRHLASGQPPGNLSWEMGRTRSRLRILSGCTSQSRG